jgi:hypothetical protein
MNGSTQGLSVFIMTPLWAMKLSTFLPSRLESHNRKADRNRAQNKSKIVTRNQIDQGTLDLQSKKNTDWFSLISSLARSYIFPKRISKSIGQQ